MAEDDAPLLGQDGVTEEEVEEHGRTQYEEHRARVEAVLERIPSTHVEGFTVLESSPGQKLIDVIEATADLDEEAAHVRYVKLPNGYASVEFLRMLFAVSG